MDPEVEYIKEVGFLPQWISSYYTEWGLTLFFFGLFIVIGNKLVHLKAAEKRIGMAAWFALVLILSKAADSRILYLYNSTPNVDERADHWRELVAKYWPISIIISLVYVALIFFLKKVMKDRERFDVRGLLFSWDSMLVIFSGVTCYNAFVDFVPDLVYKGVDHTLCSCDWVMEEHYRVWYHFFTCSKFIELGDTLFIVFRKQPSIFLHWYHHAMTHAMSWAGYGTAGAFIRWSILINSGVHTLMYFHYSLKAMRINVPRWFPMSITSIQIFQMFTMITLLFRTRYLLTTDDPHPFQGNCTNTTGFIDASIFMYFSYAVLFIRFFYKSYLEVKVDKVNGIDQNQNNVKKIK